MSIKITTTPDHLGGHMNRTWVDRGVLEYMRDVHKCNSMVDIGCGPGDQVKLANDLGYHMTVGIDGDESLFNGWQERKLMCLLHDYTRGPVHRGPPLDLAWSVEFLEHVEEEYQPHYMHTFQYARFACVTAAPPGSPGHHHVNCRPHDYWIEVFDRYGFDYLEIATHEMIKHSTMAKKETRAQTWMEESGMLFKKRIEGCEHK